MPLPFARMHGCGNDFVVLDDRAGRLHPARADLARALCDRRMGLGGDGLILIGPPPGAGEDVAMTYVNADGMEAEMCGNGARCVAWRAAQLGLTGPNLAMATGAGTIAATVSGRRVTLALPDPRDLRPAVPLAVAGRRIEVHYLDTGVPHAVVFVAHAAELAGLDVVELGAALRRHAHFAPRGANADFVAVGDPSRLALRTYERGVEAETLACGTGAVAAAAIACRIGLVVPPVAVEPKGGGVLEVGLTPTADGFTGVTLSGPTELIATGEVDDDWLKSRGLPSIHDLPRAMTSAGQLTQSR